jgi:hypothetical protein
MTLDEYTDPKRFQATTQKGLSPQDQLMIDAVNHDALRKFLAEGGKPSESQSKRWKELQVKMQYHAKLTAEVAQAEKDRKRKGE